MIRRRTSFLLALALSVAAALVGCTTLRPATPSAIDAATDWGARRAALLSMQDFALRGRVAVAAKGEGFSASLRWLQRGSRGQIQMTGPLGIGAMNIEFDGQDLQVTDAQGTVLSDAAARAEIERRLGFALPLAELSYWVRGVAAPQLADEMPRSHEELNAAGTRLTALDQAGWRIDYANQAASMLGILPQKLSARRADYRLKLVIDQWSRP